MAAGSNGSNGLEPFETEYVQGMAKSLGSESMDEIAQKLGYNNAQELADHYGFKIFSFFATQGNAERYTEIEMTLNSLDRAESGRVL
jgi:hypothetical protein